MIQPITPNAARILHHVPDHVLEAVNRLLAERINGNSPITITLTEVKEAIKNTGPGTLNQSWLNFEGHYEANGWDVEYDQPGYNESYSANYTFTPKK